MAVAVDVRSAVQFLPHLVRAVKLGAVVLPLAGELVEVLVELGL